MGAQGTYPIGTRTLAGTDTFTGVVTGLTADIPVTMVLNYVAAALASVYATAGNNSNITQLSGLTTALSIAQGGTGGTTAVAARTALGVTPGNIGAAASGVNNDITALGALASVPAVISSNVVNLVGAQTVAGVKTFSSPPVFASTPAVTAAQSMVWLNGGNGWGSTNTAIRRFSTVVANQGSDITYADSATLGGSFTINTAGVYSISYSGDFAAAGWLGVSLNDTQPTIVASNLAATQLVALAYSSQGGGNQNIPCATTLYLPVGSVIRAHDGPGYTAGSNPTIFQITRVS